MTDNELIAEFMGAKSRKIITMDETFIVYDFGAHTYEVDGLNYDKSWDWLMPVVEKIELLQYEFEIASSGTQIISTAYSEGDYYDEFTTYDSKEETKIQVVYKAIVKFVKWHKIQK